MELVDFERISTPTFRVPIRIIYTTGIMMSRVYGDGIIIGKSPQEKRATETW
jgi:hypothetical protein